jgi:hypothetical protein
MAVRTLRVKCASWDQVEAFYLRKIRRGRTATIRVPFVPMVGEPIAVALELPNDLTVAIDGTIVSVHTQGDDRSAIDIDLHGLTPEVVDRLETLVSDGRAAAALPGTVPPPSAEERREEVASASNLVVQLDGELRRLRQLAVHEVLGVTWDASAIEVRAAWRRLCQRFHPDVVAAQGSIAVSHLAEELMILANRAYDRMRAALVAEGRAASLGPALRPEKGWLVSFDQISTGDVTPAPEQQDEGPTRRRKAPTTGVPTIRFEPNTETVLDDLTMPGSGAPSAEASLRAAREATSDNQFEKQARARLAAGDHQAAREILAAALYVYPKHPPLRALYHVASAMEALDTGQSAHAAAQLEAALSVDPGCREAQSALADLRRTPRL